MKYISKQIYTIWIEDVDNSLEYLGGPTFKSKRKITVFMPSIVENPQPIELTLGEKDYMWVGCTIKESEEYEQSEMRKKWKNS